MAKVVLLLPSQLMVDQAKQVLDSTHYENLTIHEIRMIGTSTAIGEAHNAMESGAEIIIARGLQAMYIREHTNAPVVEIFMTGQELGVLVQAAKKLTGQKKPYIAFVGNVFSDMSRFEELFDIRLGLYRYRNMEEHLGKIAEAVASGPDVVIGGDLANQYASKHGIACMFYESTEESIREALRIAALMGYAIDLEKRHSAQMEALLDGYTSGMILIDSNKKILRVNHIVVEIFGKSGDILAQTDLYQLMPGVEVEGIERLLNGSLEVYQAVVQVGEQDVTVWASPFREGGEIIGATLLCHSAKSVRKNSRLAMKNMQLRGFIAKNPFQTLQCSSKQMKQAVDTAKLYAVSQSTVLLVGEKGTEKDLIAQGIHMASVRREGPYVTLSCICIDEREQEARLFGQMGADGQLVSEKCALATSSYGTLYLRDIDALSPKNQHRLLNVLNTRTLSYDNICPEVLLDLRLIVSTDGDLEQMMRAGLFREDLYYRIHALCVTVPPVRERKEDILSLLKVALEQYGEQYYRGLSLTPEAWDVLREYSWPGNLIQISTFCERLILTAPKQKVDGGTMRHLLGQLYSQTVLPSSREALLLRPEADRIVMLMEKHYGNRNYVAKELGISITTLWRRMKKYGIIVKS